MDFDDDDGAWELAAEDDFSHQDMLDMAEELPKLIDGREAAAAVAAPVHPMAAAAAPDEGPMVLGVRAESGAGHPCSCRQTSQLRR